MRFSDGDAVGRLRDESSVCWGKCFIWQSYFKSRCVEVDQNFEQIRQGCRQITSVRSQIVDQKVDGSGRPISSTEVWQIDACGQQSQYQVGLRDDGQGGTFINTRRLQP